MDIFVCIKQVPSTNKVQVDEKTGVLKRSGIQSKMNPYDLYALETALRLSCPPSECWRYQLVMIPYVRLLEAECSGDCGMFCARLEVQLEWYQLRPEVCGMRRPEPRCPELPLYPPPIQRDCSCGCETGWWRQR